MHHLRPAFCLFLAPAVAAAAQPAAPTAPAAARWQAAAGGGIVAIAREGDQPFTGLSLTRRLGRDAYVRAQGGWTGQTEREAAALAQVARETRTIGLAAGGRAGRWLIDGWATGGERRFADVLVETIPVTTTNRRRTVGDLVAVGAAVTWAAREGGGWFVGPTASLEYGRVSTRATERDPSGAVVFTERVIEEGVTGTVGVAAERALGSRAALIGGASVVAASNARSLAQREAGVPGAGDPVGEAGEAVWGEVSAGVVVRLGGGISALIATTQSIGFEPGDSTALAARLRLDF